MITLRENQGEPIRKAIDFFMEKKPKPSLIVLPTAWGKSILTACVAKSTDDRLIVLQPSKELLEQNYRKYFALCGDFGAKAGIYSASFNRKEIAQITYATIGSIKDLGDEFKRNGFRKMLIDEAHLYPRNSKSMLGKFLKESGITHVLGITATPVKLQTNVDRDGNRFSKLVMLTSRSKEGTFYKDIIHVGQVQEMVRLGYWSRLQYQVADFDDTLLKFNTSKSEYTEESVKQSYEANGGRNLILGAIAARKERRHMLVFVPTVQDAVELAAQVPGAAAIWGEQDKRERDETIRKFKTGVTRIIFNVRVLSTGFDFTGIDCIILGISTASIALYYQIIGRGTRIDPEKTDCLICDLGGNVKRFGRVEDIVFEKGGMWRMFGTGGKLLSGIPIDQIGNFTREDTRIVDSRMKPLLEIMPFGKYKGERIKDIPTEYKQWMIKTFDWNQSSERLRQSIIATL
jgi:DNA repair protein RadD